MTTPTRCSSRRVRPKRSRTRSNVWSTTHRAASDSGAAAAARAGDFDVRRVVARIEETYRRVLQPKADRR